MIRTAFVASVTLLCTGIAHGASQPQVCSPSAQASPVMDLSGTLPVADYLDAVIDCSRDRTFSDQDLRPVSPWLDAESKRYAELLARGKYDWLVLPAQTQYYGFDRIERLLIGSELADSLGDQASAPDLMLVSRALGEVRRRYPVASIVRLANQTSARRVVEAYVGHDGKSRMTLTIILKECDSTCRVLKQRDWRAIPFTNQNPPFLAVRGLQKEIREFLAVPPAPKAAATRRAADLPRLSLIAALAPEHEPLGYERLGTIAMRSALRAGGDSASRFHAASAALRLHRRPYALKLIEGLNDPAATTLRDLLNGNLTEASQRIATVKDPMQRLILALHVSILSTHYGRDVPFDPKLLAAALGAASPGWEPLLRRRIQDYDYFAVANYRDVKSSLDREFPIPNLNLKSIEKGSAVAGLDRDETDVAIANLRHLRAALAKLDATTCCDRVGQTSSWPMYWLLESTADSNVIKELWRVSGTQGIPERAMRDVGRFEAFFEGHPTFEWLRGNIAAALVRRAQGEEAERLRRIRTKSEFSVSWWSQGQSDASNAAVHAGSHTAGFAEGYSRDYPSRHFWLQKFFRNCESLEYTISDLTPAINCLAMSPPKNQPAVRASLKNRFHGHPELRTVMGDFADPAAPVVDREQRLRADIAADPSFWGSYERLLELLVGRGGYAGANKLALSFPPFSVARPRNSVELSNQSYAAGSLLYWRGEPDLARPLYEHSAGLNTGSSASITSAARLALLEQDFETAAEESLRRASRYSSEHAWRDYLSLLHAMGHAGEARDGFLQVATISQNPQIWAAELVGQRKRGMTYEQFKSWVLGDDVRALRHFGWNYAPGYAITWMTTDRKVPADFPKLMEQLDRDSPRTIDAGGVSRPSADSDRSFTVFHSSKFRVGKKPVLKVGTRVPSEYWLLGQGLSALQAADYDTALARFTQFADHYPIEYDYTKVALSYFALAAAKTGDKIGLEAFVKEMAKQGDDFDVSLSQAYFAAVRRDAAGAEKALTKAFNVRPHTDKRPIMTEYQYVEACEIVGRETGDPRFGRMALRWAKQFQRIVPTNAWSYAVEAQYSTVPADVTRALAMTLYLDPQSPRIQKFDAARIAAARAWLKANNPFVRRPRDERPRGVQHVRPSASPPA